MKAFKCLNKFRKKSDAASEAWFFQNLFFKNFSNPIRIATSQTGLPRCYLKPSQASLMQTINSLHGVQKNDAFEIQISNLRESVLNFSMGKGLMK